MVESSGLVERVAQAMGVDKEEVVLKSVNELILSELRRLYSESISVKQRYGVASSKEFDDLYREGRLDEEDTWRDYFRLSHLEERIAVLEDILSETSIE